MSLTRATGQPFRDARIRSSGSAMCAGSNGLKYASASFGVATSAAGALVRFDLAAESWHVDVEASHNCCGDCRTGEDRADDLLVVQNAAALRAVQRVEGRRQHAGGAGDN